ncbi:hypothetical protein JRO89_XS14G0160200 [Xanthoceras sorbifolium]|uniref:NAC domain-containing protein n=1 Tax=Xanthoceras sorbifolium TaxID=99658 RepID=A0ABQ8H5K3_9ROSI|nr:hypothetical protein JRO89_XS14G0160200 [Xanthoceras sorbifolium]
MQVDFPPGFRFRPTDEELVKDYLLRMVRGLELPWNGIQFCELYGDKSPWEIFHQGIEEEEEEEDHKYFYAFTRLQKASLKRVSRVAGCGTWHGDNLSAKIYGDKKNKKGLIGLKKNFSFRLKKGSKKSHWIMHEFSLAGESLTGIHQGCDYVLCRIKKKKTVVSKTRVQIHETCLKHEGFGDNSSCWVMNPFVNTQIDGADSCNNALALAVVSSEQPASVSFSCNDALYAQTPQPEDQNISADFESSKNNAGTMEFNGELLEWNISGVGSEHMVIDDNLLPIEEGNNDEAERMMVETELPCFESVFKDLSFLNSYQQQPIDQESHQVQRSCFESNVEDEFVNSMLEEYLMKEKNNGVFEE